MTNFKQATTSMVQAEYAAFTGVTAAQSAATEWLTVASAQCHSDFEAARQAAIQSGDDALDILKKHISNGLKAVILAAWNETEETPNYASFTDLRKKEGSGFARRISNVVTAFMAGYAEKIGNGAMTMKAAQEAITQAKKQQKELAKEAMSLTKTGAFGQEPEQEQEQANPSSLLEQATRLILTAPDILDDPEYQALKAAIAKREAVVTPAETQAA